MVIRFVCRLVTVMCLCLLPAAYSAAAASPGAPPTVPPDMPLTVRMEYARAGSRPVLIAIIEPHPGYYAYAHHSDTLRPTRAGLFADGRALATTVRYPAGEARKDVLSGKSVPTYTGPTPIFIALPEPLPAGTGVRLDLLLCSDARCTPADVVLPLPELPPALPAVTAGPWAAAWQAAQEGTALDAPPPQPGPSKGQVAVMPRIPFGAGSGDGTQLPTVALPVQNTLVYAAWRFSPRPAADAAEPADFGMALFWGMLAGVLLNVMPCVLPVITLKMSALLGTAGDRHDAGRIRRFREHNLLFAAGVLTWFACLAVLIGGFELTWGGLFQYAAVVAVMAGLVGVLGLSMLDLCTLPIIDLKAGVSGHPRSQAYLTGLTATLLATPCSGPLLGGVLAWSAMQPPGVLLVVFLSTGVGMALPYLLFAAWPSAVRLLPRPGNWLLVLERCVGVFLLGTTLYLLTILPLALAGLLAFALFGLGVVLALLRARRQSRGHPAGASRLPGGALAVLLLWGICAFWVLGKPEPVAEPAAPSAVVWEAFTPAAFRAVLGKEPVLLEFTADWCPNCKVLEMTTLTPKRLEDWKKRYNIRLMRVDMTNHDPEQQALLKALGSISIPLTAVFPAGADADKPILLRDLYTSAGLEAVLATLERQ